MNAAHKHPGFHWWGMDSAPLDGSLVRIRIPDNSVLHLVVSESTFWAFFAPEFGEFRLLDGTGYWPLKVTDGDFADHRWAPTYPRMKVSPHFPILWDDVDFASMTQREGSDA